MTELTVLPEGWDWYTVKDIADRVVVGFVGPSTKHYRPDGIPFLMGRNIKSGRIDLSDLDTVTQEFHDSQMKSQLNAGDVIVVRIGRSGEAAVVPASLGQANCGGLVIIKSPRAVSSEYLSRYLNSPAGLRASQAEARGVTRKTLNTRKVEQALVPVPPANEQRRIVAKIDALLERSQTAHAALKAIPSLLEKFRQSVLAAAFHGDLTADWRKQNPDVEPAGSTLNKSAKGIAETKHLKKLLRRKSDGIGAFKNNNKEPRTWAVVKVRELVRSGAILDFQDGNHGSLYPRKAEFGPEGMKFLTATQINLGRVDIDAAPRLKLQKANQLKIGFTQPNDVLLTHNATVGRVALMPDVGEQVVLGTSVTYYRTSADLLLPEFLYYQFLAGIWQQQLCEVMEQTTRNQVSINKQIEFRLIIPPVEEQRKIVERIEKRFSSALSISASLEACRLKAEALDPAILAKAFRGELLPQNPSDEPASALLDRIRSQVKDSKPKGKSRKPSRRKKVEKKRPKVASRDSDLVGVLRSASDAVTAEWLFAEAGFTDASVDLFYAQLKLAVDSGKIIKQGDRIKAAAQ